MVWGRRAFFEKPHDLAVAIGVHAFAFTGALERPSGTA
jgi:hypothetical protein